MKRTAGMMVMLATLSGCVGGPSGTYRGGPGGGGKASVVGGAHVGVRATPSIPGMQGAWGAPVAMQMPYAASPPSGEAAAKAMLAQSVPLEVQQLAKAKFSPGGPGGIQQAQFCGPNGCAPGNLAPGGYQGAGPMGLPPGRRLAGGPLGGPGAVAAVGALTGRQAGPFRASRSSVRFVGPSGMKIAWFAPQANGQPGFGAEYLEAPGRYNFLQGAIYRLKLTDIPNRPQIPALYPTLEVVPANAKTSTFLAHSAIPLSITDDDIQQVISGNYVVKVVYLPHPQFQDVATTGPDEVVSSNLEPGADPIAEALRRGSILLVLRLGNIDLEAPNTPSMNAPGAFQGAPGMPPGAPGMPPGGVMLPGGVKGAMAMPAMPPGMPGSPRVPMMPGQPTVPIMMPNLPPTPVNAPQNLPEMKGDAVKPVAKGAPSTSPIQRTSATNAGQASIQQAKGTSTTKPAPKRKRTLAGFLGFGGDKK